MTTNAHDHEDIMLQGFTVMARGALYRTINVSSNVWMIYGPGTRFCIEFDPTELTYMRLREHNLVEEFTDAVRSMVTFLNKSESPPYPLELDMNALRVDVEYGLNHLQNESKKEWMNLVASDLVEYNHTVTSNE